MSNTRRVVILVSHDGTFEYAPDGFVGEECEFALNDLENRLGMAEEPTYTRERFSGQRERAVLIRGTDGSD